MLSRRNNFREDGYMVDMLGSMLVFVFLIASLLAFVSYGRLVQMRLAIDNIAKEYLYAMEESGIFTADMQQNMTKDLQAIGCDVSSSAFHQTSPRGKVQAAYGDIVRLDVRVTFPNPVFRMLSKAEHPTAIFALAGIQRDIEYHVSISSTARW